MSAERPAQPLAAVHRLPTLRSDAEIVAGLRLGEPFARAALFDRYAPDVERVIRRILGHERHTEIADVVHDAFVAALASFAELRDPAALPAWMRSVATHTALKTIRARSRRRWLHYFAPEALPEPAVAARPEAHDACERTYRILEGLSPLERAVFSLRFIEGCEVAEVAALCRLSLSTTKRRLARAEARFLVAARRDPVLASVLAEGGRWAP